MTQDETAKMISDEKDKRLINILGEEKYGVFKRIRAAFDYLQYKGYVKSLTDLAQQLHRNYSSLSTLMSGQRGVSVKLLRDMNRRYPIFNYDWIEFGEGEMLKDTELAKNGINQALANNSPNAIVNASYNGNIIVSDNNTNDVVPNHYGDSPDDERRWCPVVPASLARQGNFDIMGHVTKQIGGNMERLYAGTAPIDVWHYVTDNDLYPFYQKGDCLGLKAYELEDRRIKTGNVYVVDTKRDGFIFRRFRLLENGDFESYTFNESDPQSYVIPQVDIIRVYSVVLMFRY